MFSSFSYRHVKYKQTLSNTIFIPNSLLCSIPFLRYPHLIRHIHSMYYFNFTPSICCHLRPMYFKPSTSSSGPRFCLTSIRSTFTYLENFKTLLLPSFTCNFLLSNTLPNSLTSLHNFASRSANSAVSSANKSWFVRSFPSFAHSSSRPVPNSQVAQHSPLAPHHSYTLIKQWWIHQTTLPMTQMKQKKSAAEIYWKKVSRHQIKGRWYNYSSVLVYPRVDYPLEILDELPN